MHPYWQLQKNLFGNSPERGYLYLYFHQLYLFWMGFFLYSSQTCWDFKFFTLSLRDMFFQNVARSVTNNLLLFLLWIVLQCILWSPNSHNGTFEWQVRHSVKISSVFLCMFVSLTIGVISKLWFMGIIHMDEARTSSFS